MTENEYRTIQDRLSAKLINKSYPSNREAEYNNGILAAKSIIKEIYERSIGKG